MCRLPSEERFAEQRVFETMHDPNDGAFVVAETNGWLLTVMDCDLTIEQARAFRDWLTIVIPDADTGA